MDKAKGHIETLQKKQKVDSSMVQVSLKTYEKQFKQITSQIQDREALVEALKKENEDLLQELKRVTAQVQAQPKLEIDPYQEVSPRQKALAFKYIKNLRYDQNPEMIGKRPRAMVTRSFDRGDVNTLHRRGDSSGVSLNRSIVKPSPYITNSSSRVVSSNSKGESRFNTKRKMMIGPYGENSRSAVFKVDSRAEQKLKQQDQLHLPALKDNLLDKTNDDQ